MESMRILKEIDKNMVFQRNLLFLSEAEYNDFVEKLENALLAVALLEKLEIISNFH